MNSVLSECSDKLWKTEASGHILELPKPVGTLKINESFSMAVYKKLPNWFHRLMLKMLLGWTYTKVSE